MHDELFAPTLMVSMMPFFHIMEITLLARSIYHQGPLALLPPAQPVTADFLMTAIVQTKPSAAAFAPSVLEEACSLSNGLETLSTSTTSSTEVLRWCSAGAFLRRPDRTGHQPAGLHWQHGDFECSQLPDPGRRGLGVL